jgi:hypothetical protein
MLEACYGTAQQSPIHLPRLRTISLRRISGLKLVQMDMPALQRFHEGRSHGIREVEGLESLFYSTVTEYGSYKRDTGLNDMIPFPNVSILALRETFQTIAKILQMLLSARDSLPALRMIEIRDNIRRPFSAEQRYKLEELVKLLKASRPNPIKVIYTNTNTNTTPVAPMYFAQVCANIVLRHPYTHEMTGSVFLSLADIEIGMQVRQIFFGVPVIFIAVYTMHPLVLVSHCLLLCSEPARQPVGSPYFGQYRRNRGFGDRKKRGPYLENVRSLGSGTLVTKYGPIRCE